MKAIVMRGLSGMVAVMLSGCAVDGNTPDASAVESIVAPSPASLQPAPSINQGYSATVCAKGKGGIQLSATEKFILLQGGICPGDDKRFKTFMATVPPGIRLVKLASGGGNGGAAQAIGILIRDAGFSTYVDGARDRCASACTHIFAGGVERFYANSTGIKTGREARVGLGYHYLNSRRTNQTDKDKDRIFNATAAVYLKRVLPPTAVEAVTALMSNNRTTQMTWLNGNEALKAGIATSLAVPPQLESRP
ncbi:MAG: hypothetical protein JNJ55_03590 [Betaproteobacteria bacterium]|nr:hypothetical protein [Betaproteobacteria bacterium]